MIKAFCMYRLKDGVSRDDYARWSREVDQQIVPRLEGVIRFETYDIHMLDDSGLSQADGPLFDYVDDIELEDWETYKKSLQSPAGAEVVRQWLTFADESSVHIILGHRIVAGIDVLSDVTA